MHYSQKPTRALRLLLVFAFGTATLADENGRSGGTVTRSPFQLSPQEAVTLIQIANGADAGSGDTSEGNVSSLQSLGLVEQRGQGMGLTVLGIQSVALLRRG